MRIDAIGPRTAEEVWRLYTRPSDWPAWAPQISLSSASTTRSAPALGACALPHGAALLPLARLALRRLVSG